MGTSVLVAGVSRFVGGALARQLTRLSGVDHVVGIDVVSPSQDLGGAKFVRADIRNPMVGRVLADHDIDTVVHANIIATPTFSGGRTPQKDINIIGTMQLLAACQTSATVRRLVVKSSTAVYGASPADPAMFTEDAAGGRRVPSGFARDSVEAEGYVGGFARRRPDAEALILRLANVVGPRIRTSLTDHFRLPVVPIPLGHDARFQLLHEDDAVGALLHAVTSELTGAVNIAGAGFLTVTQAAALARRPFVMVPLTSSGPLASAARRLGVTDVGPDHLALLSYGRGVDTTVMRTEFGFQPQFTTREAFAAYAATLPPALPAAAPLLAGATSALDFAGAIVKRGARGASSAVT